MIGESWTPGPWAVKGSKYDTGLGVSGRDGRTICQIGWMIQRSTPAKANARLIAAAPEMYAAAARVLDVIPAMHARLSVEARRALIDLHAALAKAHGEVAP